MLAQLLFALCLVPQLINADDFVGCYSSVQNPASQGTYTYQTPSWCVGLCPNSPYVALKNGNECYCLNTLPTGNTVNGCEVQCAGYGLTNCGGASSYGVFKGNGAGGSSQSSKVASATSSSATPKTSSTSSSATNAPQTTQATTTDSNDQNVVTSVLTEGNLVMYRTITLGSETATASSSSKPSESPTSSKKSSNVGPIVGGVVGGLAGLALVGLGVFLFIRHRDSDDYDDDEEFYDKPSAGSTVGGGATTLGRGNTAKGSRRTKSPLDMPMSNPFVHPSDATATQGPGILSQTGGVPSGLVDPRLNPIMMGLRRLSEGSLADEEDYSRKILHIANP